MLNCHRQTLLADKTFPAKRIGNKGKYYIPIPRPGPVDDNTLKGGPNIMNITGYVALIADAEHRIGSYIASGGSSEDQYVKDQVAKIKSWIEQLAEIERR